MTELPTMNATISMTASTEDSAFSVKINSKPDIIRILHVDDDPSNLSISKMLLQDLNSNFEIDNASCVDEALEKVSIKNYDVIVTDYVMPNKNGLDFLHELKERNNQTPFILFTGKGREEVAVKALNLGADGYYNKQGDPETVYGELAHGIKLAVTANKTKLALNETQALMTSIINSTKDMIWSISANDFTLLTFNKALSDYFLRTQNLQIKAGMTTEEIMPTKNLAENWIQLNERALKEGSFNIEYTTLIEPRVLEMVFNVIKRKERPFAIAVFARDITERKKAEEKSRQSESKYKELVNEIPEASFESDINGKMTFCNERAYELGNYKQEDIIGHNILEFVLPQDKQRVIENVKKSLTSGTLGYSEYTLHKKDGTPYPALIRTSPMIVDGKLIGLRGIVVDITNRKRIEEELKKSNKQLQLATEKLQAMGSLTRHDVGNKIMSAKSYLYLLKKRLLVQPELSSYIEGIESQLDQAIKLFEYSRLYEKIGSEQPSNINVSESFNQAVKLNHEISKIKVTNECQSLTILADSMLRQLFYNLIDNSLKHGKRVTEIKLSHVHDNDVIRLFYEDNGVGIETNKKNKIFEGYTTSGSGLGLKLVKKMIEAYGWSIKENGVPDKGARFEITIPNLLEGKLQDKKP